MLYGIFSDIHANLPALDAVMRSMDSRKVERRVSLGDIVGYGANPNECVAIVQKYCDISILGNHDIAAINKESYFDFNIYAKAAIEWTWENMTEQTKDYLDSLPFIIEEANFTFVHSSPVSPADWNYVADLSSAMNAFSCFKTQYCFIGHTHSPVIVAANKKNLFDEEPIILDGPLYRPEPDKKVLVNVGSVGQPRDRDNRACWCLVDSDLNWVEIVRVEYDIAMAQQLMARENLPVFLRERLAQGR